MDVKQFSSDKILGHLDRITEWLGAGLSRPITYELDMTNLCNHRCSYCFGFYDQNSRASLTLKEAKEIIRQIKGFAGRGLTFTGGGEPLCNPETIQAVEFAKHIGLDIGFITNGTLITPAIAEKLLENCTWIRISLDAATPEMFELTHGLNGKAHASVIENIKVLVNQKIKMSSSCTIGIGYITFPQSKKEILKFAKLCKELGADYVQYRPLLPAFSRGKADYDKKTQESILKEIKMCIGLSGKNYQVLYSKHKYDSVVGGETAKSYGKCYGHHFAAVIAADKKMYLCCHFRGVEKYCIGDLSKNTLKEIWGSGKRKKVYENIHLKDCVLLCRCNTFNTILWNIKQQKPHPNFI
jgi:GTP 3',8-cyclase